MIALKHTGQLGKFYFKQLKNPLSKIPSTKTPSAYYHSSSNIIFQAPRPNYSLLVFSNGGNSLAGIYNVKARNSDGYASTFCDNGANIIGCEGNGWTLVGRISGDPFNVSLLRVSKMCTKFFSDQILLDTVCYILYLQIQLHA